MFNHIGHDIFTGYFVSCLASSPKIASGLSAPLIIPLMLFGGFFLNNAAVPVYFQWLRYISWLMYGNEAVTVAQWQGVRFNSTLCDLKLSNNTMEAFQLDAEEAKKPCTGEEVLDRLNFSAVSECNLPPFWNFLFIYYLIVVFFLNRIISIGM